MRSMVLACVLLAACASAPAPGAEQAGLLRARAATRRGDLVAAREYWKDLYTSGAPAPEVVSGYARSLAELGEVAAASDVLGRALLDPAPAAALALQRAALLEELGRLEEALEAWERAARDEPGSAPAHAGRGRGLLLLGRPEEALEAARVAVRLAPDARAGYELLAAAALELTGVEDYYLGLAAVADRFPVEPAYLVDVVRAGVAAGTEAADLERYLARAVERDPQCVDAWRLWGALLVSRGEPQAAADKLARALELEPTDTETLLRLAELYRALGDAARLGAITDHGLSFVTDAGLRAKLERLRAAPLEDGD